MVSVVPIAVDTFFPIPIPPSRSHIGPPTQPSSPPPPARPPRQWLILPLLCVGASRGCCPKMSSEQRSALSACTEGAFGLPAMVLLASAIVLGSCACVCVCVKNDSDAGRVSRIHDRDDHSAQPDTSHSIRSPCPPTCFMMLQCRWGGASRAK